MRPTWVELESGQTIQGSHVIVACEKEAACKILGEQPPAKSNGVVCIYFGANSSPIDEPILVLNGDGKGPVNNLCVPSLLSPELAPEGKSLVSVSVISTSINESDLENAVRKQLREWFGQQVDSWDHLKTIHIPTALPSQDPPTGSNEKTAIKREDGVIQCGDYLANASIQGAMVSGREAAELVLGI